LAPSPGGQRILPGARERSKLLALARWGLPLLGSPRDHDTYRFSWLVLALEERFDPHATQGVDLTLEFRVDDEVLHVIIDSGTVQTLQGPTPDPDVIVKTNHDLFLAWGTGQLSDEQALAAGLRVTPGRQALAQLRRLFSRGLSADVEG
jgi:putative sterol carrier protein